MNVLMIGGSRTAKTVQVLERTLGQTGVVMMTEMYIEDIQNVYNRGDSFDKLVVTAQGWTHNGQYNLDQVYDDGTGNTTQLREHLIDFIADLYNRFNGNQQFIFMPDSEETAELIQGELVRMTSNQAVVMLPERLSVQFMSELILKDIGSLSPDIVYHPPVIAGFEDEGVDTVEGDPFGDSNGFESNDGFESDNNFGGWSDEPDPTFTPNVGDSGQGFDDFGDNNNQGFDSGDPFADGGDSGQGFDNFGDGQDQSGFGDNQGFGGNQGFGDNQNDFGDNTEADPYMTDDVDPNNGYDDPDSSLRPDFNDNQMNQMQDDPFGGSTVEIPSDPYGGVQVDPYGEMGDQGNPFGGQSENNGQADYNNVDPYADPYSDGANETEQNPFEQNQMPMNNGGQAQMPVSEPPQKKGFFFGKKKNSREPAVPPMQANQNQMSMNQAPMQDPYGDQGNMGYDDSSYQANPYEDMDNQMPSDGDPNARVLTDINLNDAAKLFAAFANRGNSIMVTGAPGAGTQTVAFQLANIIRLMNYNVLLVDFDVKGRSQTYISAANYNATDHDESRLAAAVNSSQGINQYVAIAAQNLHLLNLGLDIDDKPIDQVIQKNRVMKFANQAKNGHNFVIYDVPFEYAAGHLEDITTMADNLVIVVDSSTWGAMKTLLYMMNVEDDTILETLFSKSQILFNRYRGYPRILGEKIRCPEDILKAMDKELTDLVGADIGYQFRSIHVCGSLGYIDAFENGWLGKEKQQWTATREGQAAFVQILKNIVFRGNSR